MLNSDAALLESLRAKAACSLLATSRILPEALSAAELSLKSVPGGRTSGGAPEEGGDGLPSLVEEHLGVAQAAAIIDGHVDVLPADAPGSVAAIPGDPMPQPGDPAELS